MNLPLPRWVLGVLAVVALAVGVDNLRRPLANPDEGRYAEISREMVASGDWVTPRLNGVKYFEKPPLQYWATAVALKLFGENEIAARLYVALCGLATILILGFTGWRMYGADAGLASVLVLASSPYFMALGGILTLDMGLTLWTTATLCALLLAEQAVASPREHRRWMLIAWAAMALAVLSKGLVGIVFAGAAVFFAMALRRDWRVLRRLESGRGFAIFAIIAIPWFIAVSRSNPEFARFFFVHEHFERFLTTSHRRVQPAWFFIPILFAGFLPWMFALPAAIMHAWRSESGLLFKPLRISLLWSAFILAFFSASGSKLPAYILPLFPSLALVIGRYLVEAPPRRLAAWTGLAVPVTLGLLVVTWYFPQWDRDTWNRALSVEARPWAIAAAAIFLVATVGSTLLLARARRWAGIVLLAFALTATLDCLLRAYAAYLPRQSGFEMAQEMKPYLKPATRVYNVSQYDQTLPFYIGRTTTLVDYQDEFETGLKAEPGLTIAAIEKFPEAWLREGDALAIMQPGAYEKFKAAGLPMQVLHEDPRRVLVRKP